MEDSGWVDDTDYTNPKYEVQADGSVKFSDWDNPGWNQADQTPTFNPEGEAFSGAKYLQGYVVDICTGSTSHVGPLLFYGINVSGSPPSISVTAYGFTH